MECLVVMIRFLCILWVSLGFILGFGLEYVNIIGFLVIKVSVFGGKIFGLDILIKIFVFFIIFLSVCLLVLLVNSFLCLVKFLWWVWIMFFLFSI